MRCLLLLFFTLQFQTAFSQSKHELDSLTVVLEKIMINDQQYRMGWDSAIQQYGMNSPEFIELLRKTSTADSLDMISVGAILDKYGWLSKEETSEHANAALFLVLQHARLKKQLNYLPLMEKAVADHKAASADLALLVDRTNMYQGKYQVYGSQLNYDAAGNLHVYPISDEPNVNTRRKSVGLAPMEEYTNLFNKGFVYKLPVTDVYSMKTVMRGSVTDSKTHQGLPDVMIFSANGLFITKTDSTGFFEILVGRNRSIKVLSFRKKRYETYEFINTDFTKEIIEINPALIKK